VYDLVEDGGLLAEGDYKVADLGLVTFFELFLPFILLKYFLI
jgi:hypothetical protein